MKIFTMKNLSFYLIFVSLLFGCKESVDIVGNLPEKTNKGKMTFGCILDGKEMFAAYGDYEGAGYSFFSDCKGGMNTYYESTPSGKGLVIYAVNCGGSPEYKITMSIYDSIIVGKNIIFSDRNNRFSVQPYGSYGVIKNISVTNKKKSGYVRFTHFSDSIYSGVFEAIVSDSNRDYIVSHGRFDIRVK
jgi:hypothetical protein